MGANFRRVFDGVACHVSVEMSVGGLHLVCASVAVLSHIDIFLSLIICHLLP